MGVVVPERLDAVIAATWPPAKTWVQAGVTLRDDAGGQRVSAATVDGPVTEAAVAAAEDAMRPRGAALFRIRDGQADFDHRLAARGYATRDPTTMLAAPVGAVADQPLKPVSGFAIWPPLAIMEDLFAAAGIDAARRAVMDRATGPKTAIFGRGSDQPAGIGFVAVHDGIAMIHAVDVVARLRRQKIAHFMMIAAARWARDQGATHVATLCVSDNAPALGLYTRLGFARVGQYHYRTRPLDP